MQASDYIRASDAAQAMTKYCREQGWTWAVAPPGSKGHPFLVITANGTRFRQPFSLTPSDKKRAALNAVRDLKRAAYEAGAINEPQEANVKTYTPTPVAPMSYKIATNAEGMPIPPKGLRLAGDTTLGRGAIPINQAYSKKRKAWICKKLKAGASCAEIAETLTQSGVKLQAQSVEQIGYALRRDGLLPDSWSAKLYSQRPEPSEAFEAPAVIEHQPPIEAKPDLRPALNGRFGELVTDALCAAREKSAADADEMAARWIEQIAKARGEAERQACERRYERVLEVLTS